MAKKSFLEGNSLFVSFHHVMLFVTLNYYAELRRRNLGHFPYVITDRPDRSCRNEISLLINAIQQNQSNPK